MNSKLKKLLTIISLLMHSISIFADNVYEFVPVCERTPALTKILTSAYNEECEALTKSFLKKSNALPLVVSSRELTSLKKGDFHGLNLKYLIIKNNPNLTVIEADAISRIHFTGSPLDLEQITISTNQKLTTIKSKAFNHLDNFNSLKIKNNKVLNALDPGWLDATALNPSKLDFDLNVDHLNYLTSSRMNSINIRTLTIRRLQSPFEKNIFKKIGIKNVLRLIIEHQTLGYFPGGTFYSKYLGLENEIDLLSLDGTSINSHESGLFYKIPNIIKKIEEFKGVFISHLTCDMFDGADLFYDRLLIKHYKIDYFIDNCLYNSKDLSFLVPGLQTNDPVIVKYTLITIQEFFNRTYNDGTTYMSDIISPLVKNFHYLSSENKNMAYSKGIEYYRRYHKEKLQQFLHNMIKNSNDDNTINSAKNILREINQ